MDGRGLVWGGKMAQSYLVYPEVVSLPFNSELQEIILKTTSHVFGLVGLLSRSSYFWNTVYQEVVKKLSCIK